MNEKHAPGETPVTGTGVLAIGITAIVFLVAELGPLLAIDLLLGIAPPFFPQLAIVGSILGLAIICWAQHREKLPDKLPQRAVAYLVSAILTFTIYFIILDYFTVTPPGGRKGQRRQIGFFMASWSLTEEARKTATTLENREPPIESNAPNDLMNIFGVWGGEGRTDEIWKLWTIVISGLILVMVFLGAFYLWAYGLGILITYFSLRGVTGQTKGTNVGGQTRETA